MWTQVQRQAESQAQQAVSKASSKASSWKPFPTHYVGSTMGAALPSQSLKEPGSTYHVPPLSQLLETMQLTLAIKIIYLKKLATKTTLIWQFILGIVPQSSLQAFYHKLTRKPEQPIERAVHILTGSRDELFVKLISHDRFGKIPETNEGDHSFGGRSNQTLDSQFYKY